MRNTIGMAALMVCMAAAAGAQDAPVPQSQKEKVSYGIGMDIAKGFKQRGLDLDAEMISRGLRDGFTGAKALMTEEEIIAVLTAYQKELQQKAAEAAIALADKNKKEGDAFLAANKTKEGVITLASGLQYRILQAGTGKLPTEADTVDVHYQGSLLNGTVFDSSIKRGQPETIPVKGVILGWQEALKLMPVGSKWQLFIPSELGYGLETNGSIGPNSVLLFDVELLAIK